MTSEEFTALFNKYYDRLYYYAHSLLKDSGLGAIEAEDVLSETFIKVWNGKFRLDERYANIYRPLCICIKNVCLDVIRDHRKRENSESEIRYLLYQDADNYVMIEAEVISSLYDQMEKLPNQQRLVFKGYCRGLSTPEIAKELKTSCRCVINQKARAVNKLKDWLINGAAMQGKKS